MQRTRIKQIYRDTISYKDKEVTVAGWIRQNRDSKTIGFIELNDGSFFKGIQIVLEEKAISNFSEIIKLNLGASIKVTGVLIETPNAKQLFEIHAKNIEVLGISSRRISTSKQKTFFRIFENYCTSKT